MENPVEDAPLANEYAGGSREALVTPAVRGGSNSRALKIAGLTTLVCLLVCSQVFTAYMVFNQKEQLRTLQRSTERLRSLQSHPGKPMSPMRLPMNTLPLLRDFDPNAEVQATKRPLTKLQDTAVVSVEKQLMELMEDFKLPQFSESFQASIQSLKQQMNETEWKSFESWMHYWLIFQMAQHKPAEQPSQEVIFPVTRTKCQLESAAGVGRIGSHKPQCDEHGAYESMQCWHATGNCWCVDENGAAIEGTLIRGRPDCKALDLDRVATTPEMELMVDEIGA